MINIENNKLEELYKACGGKMSHYIFLDNEDTEVIKLLVKDGYIKFVPNTSDKKMYTCTERLIIKFRILKKDESLQVEASKIIETEDYE